MLVLFSTGFNISFFCSSVVLLDDDDDDDDEGSLVTGLISIVSSSCITGICSVLVSLTGSFVIITSSITSVLVISNFCAIKGIIFSSSSSSFVLLKELSSSLVSVFSIILLLDSS